MSIPVRLLKTVRLLETLEYGLKFQPFKGKVRGLVVQDIELR